MCRVTHFNNSNHSRSRVSGAVSRVGLYIAQLFFLVKKLVVIFVSRQLFLALFSYGILYTWYMVTCSSLIAMLHLSSKPTLDYFFSSFVVFYQMRTRVLCSSSIQFFSITGRFYRSFVACGHLFSRILICIPRRRLADGFDRIFAAGTTGRKQHITIRYQCTFARFRDWQIQILEC